MLDKTALIPTLNSKIEKLSINHYIELRTYKRNRSVIVVKRPGGKLLIIENGFFQEEFEIEEKKLKKTFKTLLKKEFPRSNKIRIYQMGEFERNKAVQKKRKVL